MTFGGSGELRLLGIGSLRGVAQLFAREEAVVAGSEETAEVYRLAGCGEVEVVKRGGQLARRGDVVLRAVGEARCLHATWRTAQEVVAWAPRGRHEDEEAGGAGAAGQPKGRGGGYAEDAARPEGPVSQGGAGGRGYGPQVLPLRRHTRL